MPGLFHYFEQILQLDRSQIRYLDADLVFARLDDDRIYEAAYGDAVTDVIETKNQTTFTIVGGRLHGVRATVKNKLPLRDSPILRWSMIDVQQGDGLVLETARGEIVLIDGGDNKLFARHLSARYAGTTKALPLQVDAIVVTHGDADHFAGLSEIRKTETQKKIDPKNRVFLAPDRILHNGLAKRPGKRPDKSDRPDREQFGTTKVVDGTRFITELIDDFEALPDEELNVPFREWRDTLQHWQARREALGMKPMLVRRVDHTMASAFDFLQGEQGIDTQVLGPIMERVGSKPALRFLKAPPNTAELHLEVEAGATGSDSASHTINGHSVAFRMQYGNVRIMLTGDMNHESMNRLRHAVPEADLKAEILKTPHHGSADFDFKFLKAVSPVVSMISSGDENTSKEYIHPRATLVSALGRASRGDTGIVFITELAAFFAVRGYATEVDPSNERRKKAFFAFERTNFGIIHVRSNGERVLAFTHSGKRGMNEAYGFRVDALGKIKITPRLMTVR